MSTNATGSTVPRRQLGRALRRARENANMTTRVAAKHLDFSEVKMWRLERGHSPFRQADIRAMCMAYSVDAETTEKYVAMAPATREKGWWHAYDDVIPAGFDLYLGLEQVATNLNIYQQEVVPGLLQTPDYVRAMRQKLTDDEIEQSIEIKRERQTLITRQVAPTTLNVVLSEAVLRRAVGGPRTMHAQLRYLAQLCELPNVGIRIAPFAAGFHPGILTGPFIILHFQENGIGDEVEPPAVYIEGATGELWLDREHEVGSYEDIFANILVAAADENGYTARDMLWRASMEVQ